MVIPSFVLFPLNYTHVLEVATQLLFREAQVWRKSNQSSGDAKEGSQLMFWNDDFCFVAAVQVQVVYSRLSEVLE